MSSTLTRPNSSPPLYLTAPEATPLTSEVERLKNRNDKFRLHFVRVVRGMLKALPKR